MTMKSFMLLAVLLFMIPDTSKTLEDFRWKKRIVISNFTDLSIDSLLASSETQIEERKMLFVEFEKSKFIKSSGDDKIEFEAFLEVLANTKPTSDWILIGLDGGVKASGAQKDFSLVKIFRLIDQMPMRQTEIGD